MGNMGILVLILCLTPITEILVGTLRSDNKKYVILMPLMVFFFILNIFICFNAVFNLFMEIRNGLKLEDSRETEPLPRNISVISTTR